MRWLLEDMRRREDRGAGSCAGRDELAASPRLRAELAAAEAADAHPFAPDAARHAVGVEFEEPPPALHALAVPFGPSRRCATAGSRTPTCCSRCRSACRSTARRRRPRRQRGRARCARAARRQLDRLEGDVGDARTFREDHLQLRAYVHGTGPGP